MDLNPGVIAGIVIAIGMVLLARHLDRRQHQDRLKRIQDRIRRSESRGVGVDSAESRNEKGP